jgi:hypothetical protein
MNLTCPRFAIVQFPPHDQRTRPMTNEPRPPEAPPEERSDAILPFGDKLDEIAQERFNRTDWIEIAAAVLLALATIIAAWSAYQSTRWGGEQAAASSSALAARTTASQATTLFAGQTQIDVQLWILWLQQRQVQDASAETFVEERFREEFKPAFDAWLAQVPDGSVPPGTPFEVEEWASEARDEATRLNEEAETFATDASRANQLGDNFVLTAVLMASVLFFAGVGTKLKGRGVRLFMLLIAILLFLGAFTFMISLPQNVGI